MSFANGYQHFLLFPQCFPNVSLTGLLKVMTVWYSVSNKCVKKELFTKQKIIQTFGKEILNLAHLKTEESLKSKKYSQTSEARTRESSNTTENSNKNLGPDKKCS